MIMTVPTQMQPLGHIPVSLPLVAIQGNLMNLIEFTVCNRKNWPTKSFWSICACVCVYAF